MAWAGYVARKASRAPGSATSIGSKDTPAGFICGHGVPHGAGHEDLVCHRGVLAELGCGVHLRAEHGPKPGPMQSSTCSAGVRPQRKRLRALRAGKTKTRKAYGS
jgi:hypothetical protein